MGTAGLSDNCGYLRKISSFPNEQSVSDSSSGEKKSVSGGKVVLRKAFVVLRSEAGKKLAKTKTPGGTCRCPDQVFPFGKSSLSSPNPYLHGGAGGSWESSAEKPAAVPPTLWSPGWRPQQHQRYEKQKALPSPVSYCSCIHLSRLMQSPGAVYKGHPFDWEQRACCGVSLQPHTHGGGLAVCAAQRAPVPEVQGGDS